MPRTGQIMVNPDTGDVYEFLATANDTNGQRVAFITVNKNIDCDD